MLSWEDKQKIQLKKRTYNPSKDAKSCKTTVYEILDTITSNEDDINNKVPKQELNSEDDLLHLF